MPPRVLVTGAAGFAGGHLLDLLSRDRHDIIAWRRPGGAASREVPCVRWRAVDMLDRAAVRDALKDAAPALIYNCAGAAHVGHSWDNVEATFAVNVRGTHNLIEALRELGRTSRVLITGSATVYAAADVPLTEGHPVGPASPYAVSKLAQEMLGRGNGDLPPVLLARAFNHFGPRQDAQFAASAFARRIAAIEAGRSTPELPVGNLSARRDLTDVRDTVRAYRAIVERGVPGRLYNVCSGRAIAIGDLLDLMLSRARVRVKVVRDPSRYRPNDAPLVVGDPSRIHAELGWKAEIPLEQTVDDLLDYWRSR